MTFFTSVDTGGEHNADSLLSVFQAALSARSQVGWSRWLQGEIQAFLPHYALIAAWGDFTSGALAYDVISLSPAVSLQHTPKHHMEHLMMTLFERWLRAGQEPVVMQAEELCRESRASLSLSRPDCGLIHGVQDHRSRYDCIYLFIGPQELATSFARQLSRMLLPFIDTGLRQLADRGQQQPHREPWKAGVSESSYGESSFGDSSWTAGEIEERGAPLSARELEIMQWVRIGKTNSEIAMILNLSTFTVKNHMRRIYKKLDVLNRAQAVGSLDRIRASRKPLMVAHHRIAARGSTPQ